MRGCATHWNACRRRPQWKTTKRCCRGIAHLKYIAECSAHLGLGGVYGALTVVETKGGNHKTLKEWKTKHGSDMVEGWLSK